jgi:mono/diheme cytochrome c family protein
MLKSFKDNLITYKSVSFMNYQKFRKLVWVALVVSIGACQGRPSDKPPIHLNPNMDHQPKFKPQSYSDFFENNSTMRLPVAGTVARGNLRDDAVYYTGRDEKGNLIAQSPVATDMDLLMRGRERYTIYCAPCHGAIGDGRGIVVQRGYLPPPSYHTDILRKQPDGHFFDVMTNGIRNMASYKNQVSVNDRWAIVAYIRALQRSQNAGLVDVPQEMRKDLK